MRPADDNDVPPLAVPQLLRARRALSVDLQSIEQLLGVHEPELDYGFDSDAQLTFRVERESVPVIEDVTDAWLRLFAYQTRDQVVGRSTFDVVRRVPRSLGRQLVALRSDGLDRMSWTDLGYLADGTPARLYRDMRMRGRDTGVVHYARRTPDSGALVVLDGELRFLVVTQPWLDLFGYSSAGELIGRVAPPMINPSPGRRRQLLDVHQGWRRGYGVMLSYVDDALLASGERGRMRREGWAISTTEDEDDKSSSLLRYSLV
jgi:PAS domain-containing protein